MNNVDVIKTLRDIKTYCAASSLDELEYAIKVLEKLESEGVKKPLETDFKKLGEN